MPGFLSSLGLSKDHKDADKVRWVLSFVQRSRLSLELSPALAAAGNGSPESPPRRIAAMVEQVDQDSIVISQPTVGTLSHPLINGERLRLTMRGPDGRYEGIAMVRGRAAISAGGGGKLYGYRLSLPDSLTLDERRGGHRIPMGFDVWMDAQVELTIEANCEVPKRTLTAKASVMDVSIRGMKLKVEESPAEFVKGARVVICFQLPDPTRTLRLPAMIRHVMKPGNRDEAHLGIKFDEEVEPLVEFIRRIEIRRRQRQRYV
jgi:hypothetical protein